MKNVLLVTTILLGLTALALAGLALTGVATLRQPNPTAAAIATTLLLLLPVLGISALFPRRSTGFLLGAIAWPVLVLIGLPLYFPGEREDALNLGLTLLGLPIGHPIDAEKRAAWSKLVDDTLVTPHSRRPLPPASPAPEDPLPPPVASGEDDQVTLPYEGTGHSLQIPVTVDGPRGQALETALLFDTGATYTTLDTRTLTEAGYAIPASAPTIKSHTANGEIVSPLVRVERLWVGGLEVPGVTVAVCDACAEGLGYKGVLGLNVSSRFLVTLDTARKEMILRPRQNVQKLRLDIEPWVQVDGHGTRWADGRTEVQVEVTSNADRPIQEAEVTVRCPGGDYRVDLGTLAPRQNVRQKVAIPREGACEKYQIFLDRATW